MSAQIGLFERRAAPIGVGRELGLVTRGDARAWATLSPDERYRYALARLWDDYYDAQALTRPLFVACCLNPSTADHEHDDPTVRKLIGYAKRERCGGLVIINLFAWRATEPRELVRALERDEDPVGEHNAEVIRRVVGAALLSYGVAAWGCIISKRLRKQGTRSAVAFIQARNGAVRCFGTNEDGSPKHPLYLRGDAPLVPWKGSTR